MLGICLTVTCGMSNELNVVNVQTTVDVPTGASGFTDDVPQQHSDVAASASADDKVREFDCGMRLSSSNASASNSSFSDRRSSTSSDVDQKNVEHNHTYPLTPAQRRRREQEEKDERATRCRDEKKAKDMHVRYALCSLRLGMKHVIHIHDEWQQSWNSQTQNKLCQIYPPIPFYSTLFNSY